MLAACLAAIAMLYTGSAARASMALAASLAELVEEADLIVVARTVEQHGVIDAHGRVATDVRLVVERVDKGETREGDTLHVRHLGGQVGDRGLTVVGAPVFREGESQLLFLVGDLDDPWLSTLELSQGRMAIFERDGSLFVRGGGEGLALMQRKGARMEHAAHARPRALNDVLDEIRALLDAEAP